MSKAYVKYLPKDRPFTKLEAGFSVQVNFDNKTPVTLAGLSGRFGWSRNKTRLFFEEIGVEIMYQGDTKKLRNQKGHIKRHKKDISEIKKGHIRFIDSSDMQAKKDISEQNKGHKKDNKKDTINDPIPLTILDPKKQVSFESDFWPVYPKRNSKKLNKPDALEQFLKLNDLETMQALRGVKNFANSAEITNGINPPDAFRWLQKKKFLDWQERDQPHQSPTMTAIPGSVYV
jgi:hypothetical protein